MEREKMFVNETDRILMEIFCRFGQRRFAVRQRHIGKQTREATQTHREKDR